MIEQLVELFSGASDDIKELEQVQKRLETVSDDLEDINHRIEQNIK